MKQQEYFFEMEGCYITELSNTANDPAVSIARARLTPGVTTAWHRLNAVVERYCILAGHGLVEIGDMPAKAVCEGDVVTIAPMQRQRITNIGDEDLIFLAVCTPRFTIDCYESLA